MCEDPTAPSREFAYVYVSLTSGVQSFVVFFSLSMDRRSASLSHQSVDPRVALLRRIRWWWFGSELGLFKEKEHLIGMLSVTVKGRCLFPEQSGVCCHTVTLIVRPSFFINAWLPPLTVSSCTVI